VGVRAVIFDMDGVLVDSMPPHVRSWVEAFARIAGIKIERKTLYVLEGMRGAELVEKMLAERGASMSLAKKVVEEKDRLFKEMERPRAFEGVKDMIDSLPCAKAVVSGSSRHDVESLLDETIGKDRFDTIITADDTSRGKPDPLAFQAALEKLRVRAKDAVVVENAPLGVRAANNAGIPCYVALNTTLLGRADFAGIIEAERIFEKTSSLKGPLQELCRR
jgi:HAD superfamily hydrolase (TIGR01509 family)